MEKKLIFLDIDGTFTEAGQNVPPESAMNAVRQARANGHRVFICTGRNESMAKPVIDLGFDGYITSAGGYVVCDKVIYDMPMTDVQRNKVVDVLRMNGIYMTVETKDGSYTDDGFKQALKSHGGQGNSELLRWREQIEKELGIRSLTEYDGAPVYKVILMAFDIEQVMNAKRLLDDEFHVILQGENDGVLNGEIISRAFDKGMGIRKVCEYLGADVKDTIAYGDSMNDLEMLQTAGISICMENGSDKLKELADEVCGSVEEDGLYQSFQKHGLI